VGAKRARPERLFATRWVHLFEEDTSSGAVYCPEDRPVPLSRRPRERLELRADGSAALFVPGPDDRFVQLEATWHDERGSIVIRSRTGGTELRIIDRSSDRLVVQVRRAAPTC
jgi:hypothetical protein